MILAAMIMAPMAAAQYSYCTTNSDPAGGDWTTSSYLYRRHNSCYSFGSSEVKGKVIAGMNEFPAIVFNGRTDWEGYRSYLRVWWTTWLYGQGIISIVSYKETASGITETNVASWTTAAPPQTGNEMIAVYRNNNNQGNVGRGIMITAGGTTGFYALPASFDGQVGEVSLKDFSEVSVGAIETGVPSAVSAGSIVTGYSGGQFTATWTAATDSGIGRVRYEIYKNLTKLQDVGTASVSFAAGPGEVFDLKVRAYDGHRNFSAEAVKSVSTPPATSGVWDDSRRIGVHALGSYWGDAGEKIDVRSMNLNFSQGLLSVKGRAGAGLGIGLSYNSQLWRKENSTIWKMGGDTGLGFGWRLMAGSVAPVWSSPTTFSHYVFIDATGAEYKLDINSGNVWKGKEGTYVWYDANYQRLHFKDGSYWQMDCISGISEADAGSRYPTRVFDRNGNYVELNYMSVNNGAYINQTSRIWFIYDARSGTGPVTASYQFTWNSDTVPHLTSVAPQFYSNAEHYAFSYSADNALIEPFNNATQYGSARRLNSFVQGQGTRTQSFEYNVSVRPNPSQATLSLPASRAAAPKPQS
jgi:hypothetical protein